MVKEGTENPERFAKNQAKDAVIGALIVPIVILILFLGFLFVLSYTQVLGGPYGIARFFFWLLVVIYGISGSALYFIGRAVKRVFSSGKSMSSHQPETSPNGSTIRDAEIVDKT